MSHLTRGAWIEINVDFYIAGFGAESHLTRGAWIEIANTMTLIKFFEESHLTRGAWIEMPLLYARSIPPLVAPHTRCVD